MGKQGLFLKPANFTNYRTDRYYATGAENSALRPVQRSVEPLTAVASVDWRALVPLTPMEVGREVLLSAPWLALSLYCASQSWYACALGCSFVFFLTALRQVHNAFHYAMGLPRAVTEWIVFALSVLMLGSNHAVKVTHLLHHRECLGANDIEGRNARVSGLRAILCGPAFPVRVHAYALRHADAATRRWILAELAVSILWIGLVFGVLHSPVATYHVCAMLAGQWLAGFFCVWTVHHDCDNAPAGARTERNRLVNRLSFNMLLHLEHHLYPAVPTCHLPELARRLDRAVGGAAWPQVL